MSRTLTGGFPIGFRYAPLSSWSENLDARITWARANGFGTLDLGKDPAQARTVRDAGLQVGSVDLLEWQPMLSLDPAQRKDAVAKNAAYVEACAEVGATNHFVVMLPEDPAAPPHEVFAAMVSSFSELAPTLERFHAKIVIEGWPGPGALCCTPESYRAFFEACPSPAMGVNYDPSHLIRMGIDPLRFLGEFVSRVYHVHAKDAEVFEDRRYEYGTEQRPLFGETHRFGGPFWRYTVPGHGVTPWKRVFETLVEGGYRGCVSVELEDHYFNGQEETEKLALSSSSYYLQAC